MKINETRVFGSPGCGKTTYISKQITLAAEQFGAESILVASFTRAAAKELISRDQAIPTDQIGTLHAHCFRLLGKPEIAEAKASEFNEEYPHFAITPSGNIKLDDGLTGGEDAEAVEGGGDELMSQLSIYRARMTPKDLWAPSVLEFSKAWADFKQQTGYLDFQDLIDVATTDYYPPNKATIGVFDEAQDFTPSQLRLIRSWGRHMKWIMIAGDDDQVLYSFTGATPDAFLNPPVPQEFKRILKQSYRVPRKIVKLAMSIIKKVSVREPKEYRPRDEDGRIYGSDATWRNPKDLLPTIKGFLKNEASVMILASCSYFLGPTLKMLREAGIPFSNVYKSTRGDWNPIRMGRGEKAGNFGRYAAFVQPEGGWFKDTHLWTPTQFANWMDVVKSEGNFKRGAKTAIKQLVASKSTTPEDMLRAMVTYMEESAFNAAISLDHEWFLDNLVPSKAASFEYPSKIYNNYGPEAVTIAKELTIGTIHSVKGAEASCVILFPDLSLRGAQQYALRSGEGFDQILRQFYVGVTRSRHSLILCKGATSGMFFNDYM